MGEEGNDMNQQLQTQDTQQRQLSPIEVLTSNIDRAIKFFGAMMKADQAERSRFKAEVVQAVHANPKLLDVDRGSLMFAIGEAASAGLSVNPNLGEAWLIPRTRSFKVGDNWEKIYEANFQPGVRGVLKLAYRSNLIDSIFYDVAYDGEVYARTGGTSPGIEHEPDDEYRTGRHEDIIGAYAVVWLKGSSRPIFASLSRAQLITSAGRSGNPKKPKEWSNVWSDHFEEMAKKTVLIRVCKLLPRSDDLRPLLTVSQRDLVRDAGNEPPRLSALQGMEFEAAPQQRSLAAKLSDPSAPPNLPGPKAEAADIPF